MMIAEPRSRNVMLVLEYEGTDFHGFQYQVGQRTVQGEVEAALRRILGETIRIAGAGRTDAGVHATGQVATFTSNTGLSAEAIRSALNGVLPRDVVVRKSRGVPNGFHARFSAVARSYRYSIWNGDSPTALWRRLTHQWRGRLDVAAMAEAAALVLGEHDFASFAGTSGSPEDAPKSTIRRVMQSEWRRRGELVEFQITANAFLPHMVRNLVGTLLLVGGGKVGVGGFREVLEARDRRVAGPTAPARGLCLTEVEYAPSAFSIQPSAREVSAGGRNREGLDEQEEPSGATGIE